MGDDSDVYQLNIYDAGVYTGMLNSNFFGQQKVFVDSLPINLLGSQSFLADSIILGDYWIRNPTVIEFDNPVQVNSSFIVSLVPDSELSDDTIIVWHSVPGDGQQEYRTSTLLSTFSDPQHPDTLWMRDKYHRPSYDVDLMISPVLEIDTLTTIVGIGDLDDNVRVDVQPNPFIGELNVTMNGLDQAYRLELYSAEGKKVFAKRISGTGRMQLDLRHFASGMYNLVVRDEFGIQKKHLKVVKME